MAFQLSPYAKEFVPANPPALVFQSSSSGVVGAASVRPKQYETQSAFLNTNLGQNIEELNIADPEFNPLADLPFSAFEFDEIDEPQRNYEGKDSGPKLLDQIYSTRQSATSSPDIKSLPSVHQSRRGIYHYQLKQDRQDVSLAADIKLGINNDTWQK